MREMSDDDTAEAAGPSDDETCDEVSEPAAVREPVERPSKPTNLTPPLGDDAAPAMAPASVVLTMFRSTSTGRSRPTCSFR